MDVHLRVTASVRAVRAPGNCVRRASLPPTRSPAPGSAPLPAQCSCTPWSQHFAHHMACDAVVDLTGLLYQTGRVPRPMRAMRVPGIDPDARARPPVRDGKAGSSTLYPQPQNFCCVQPYPVGTPKANSFISAMFTSRWVFSTILAASAIRMLAVFPRAVTMIRR